MEKLGMIKAKQKKRNKIPERTLTTPPDIIVEKNTTKQETVNAQPKQSSKTTKKNSDRRNKENMGTNLFLEEETKYW